MSVIDTQPLEVLQRSTGMIKKFVCSPLNRTKLIRQNLYILQKLKVVKYPENYQGLTVTLKTILRNEGWMGLLRGLLPEILWDIPGKIVRKAIRDIFLEILQSFEHTNETEKYISSLVSSLITNAGALLLTYPFELVSTKLAVDILNEPTGSYQYPRMWGVFTTVIAKNGFWTLYRGYKLVLWNSAISTICGTFLRSIFPYHSFQ
jgi:hypothetical protein